MHARLRWERERSGPLYRRGAARRTSLAAVERWIPRRDTRRVWHRHPQRLDCTSHRVRRVHAAARTGAGARAADHAQPFLIGSLAGDVFAVGLESCKRARRSVSLPTWRARTCYVVGTRMVRLTRCARGVVAAEVLSPVRHRSVGPVPRDNRGEGVAQRGRNGTHRK
jgi:hypothetical protein